MERARISSPDWSVEAGANWLHGHWPMTDGAGNALADASDQGLDMVAPVAFGANFWGTADHGQFESTADTASYSLTAEDRAAIGDELNSTHDWVISARFQRPASPAGNVNMFTLMTGNGSVGLRLYMNSVGRIYGFYADDSTNANALTTAGWGDGTEHSAIWVNDGALQTTYVYTDAALSAGGATQDFSGLGSAVFVPANDPSMWIGSRKGTADYWGADSGTRLLADIQFFIKAGGAPISNIPNLVRWIHHHPYEAIPHALFGV